MRTRRLYHEDGTLRSFEAEVVEVRDVDGGHHVILDATAFYPTGGGQPHDTGYLGPSRVVEVMEQGGVVLHRIEGDAPAGRVTGTVDWDRRRDHRQQHTGQHILSRALLDIHGAKTIGFHLGEERSTIDLDRELGETDLQRGEDQANAVVLEDRPITVTWYDTPEEVPSSLRSELPDERPIRLVEVDEFDTNACCGTHCDRTGQVGAIKILRWERHRNGSRVEFVSGERALRDYGRRHQLLRSLALELTTEEADIPKRVRAFRDDAKAFRARAEAAEEELRERLAEAWSGETGTGLLVRELSGDRANWLAPLATAVAERSGRPVLLASEDAAVRRVALACPGEANAGVHLRESLTAAGGKGGGNTALAQGQVPLAGWSVLVNKLQAAELGSAQRED